MTCAGLETFVNGTIGDIMAYPTTCDIQFYAKIMAAIFIIFTFLLHTNDRRREVKPDLISNLGVSALAVIVISLIGTLLTIIKQEIFIEILVVGLIFVAIWMFKD